MHCYARSSATKIFPLQKKVIQALEEEFWTWLDGDKLAEIIARKHTKITHIRIAGRGEFLSSFEDIRKVNDIVRKNPDILFWLPTRAWVNTNFRQIISDTLLWLPNVFLQASTDIETPVTDIYWLLKNNWNISFFGEKNPTFGGLTTEFLCPKTWNYHVGQKDICATCLFCFKPSRQIVHHRQTQLRRRSNNFTKFVY
jgi:hypothetical protein